jgi:glycine cleavage system H protein
MVALFVVLMFVTFIIIDLLVLKAQGKEHPALASVRVFDKGSFLFPKEIYLTKGHTWIRLMKDKLVKVGIDELVVKAFNNLQLIPLHNEGVMIKKGETLFEARNGKHRIKFVSPIDGEIKSVNKNLEFKTMDDPYFEDWGVTILPTSIDKELGLMKTGEKGLTWLKHEFNRLKDFVSHSIQEPSVAGLTLADGGNLVEGVLSNFDEKVVDKFEKEFLVL